MNLKYIFLNKYTLNRINLEIVVHFNIHTRNIN